MFKLNKIDDTLAAKILKLIDEGFTRERIKARLGITEGQLKHFQEKNGVRMPAKRLGLCRVYSGLQTPGKARLKFGALRSRREDR